MLPETPKSKAGRRTVSFPAELVPELRWHLERFSQPGERGLIFVGPKGAPLRRSNIRPIWNSACARAGMPGLHFHDLRHVGGTLAEMSGVAPVASFSTIREHGRPTLQRTRFPEASGAGWPPVAGDLRCHRLAASDATVMQPARLHRMTG